jgi:long-subunit acyl-CoA synthetase (AMP-forming)
MAIAAQSNLYGYSIDSERVTLLSYLPLAHIYEVRWQLVVRALPSQSTGYSESIN